MTRTLKERFVDAAWTFAADLRYRADGLATAHACDFMSEERFANAYADGLSTNPRFGPNLHVEWRIFVCCWAAAQAQLRGADLVECGVNTGLNALAVARYLNLDKNPFGTYYLLDTFEGIPQEQAAPGERGNVARMNRMYTDCFDDVVKTFAPFSSVRLIRGSIPDTLAQVDSNRVGYLAIDLNVAYPERAALEYFWDRLIPGSVVVLDDYGWKGHERQREVHREFALEKGVMILALPTGQGILLKP